MLHDRILVALRREDGERRSTGGILIPATAQVAKRLVWGEARGVGGSVRQVKVGDQVLFSPDDQHEGEVHGEDLIILRGRDVHAVAAERIEESTGLYLWRAVGRSVRRLRRRAPAPATPRPRRRPGPRRPAAPAGSCGRRPGGRSRGT